MSDFEKINKALVQRIYDEIWNQGNPAAARELFTKPEGVERLVWEILTAFPDLQHMVE